MSRIHQLRVGYWGLSVWKSQVPSYGLPSPRPQDTYDESQQQAEGSGVGRSWVQSMFSRESSIRANSFARVRKWTSDVDASGTSQSYPIERIYHCILWSFRSLTPEILIILV